MTGQQLEQWRKLHNLTQSKLGKYLNISQVTISRWENSVFPIEHGKILELALKQVERDIKNQGSK